MKYSKKQLGRVSGILYLFLAITASFAIVYVPSQVIKKDNIVQTITNIRNNELLYRSGILSHLVSQVIFIFMGLVLYRLLKSVDEHKAKAMIVLVTVQIPIVFVIEAFKIAALEAAKGNLLQRFSQEQAQDIFLLLLKLHNYGIATMELFWGLWLVPLGQLVYKSGFMPKFLAILLLVGAAAYIIESISFFLFPVAHSSVVNFTFVFYSLAEVCTILWLLISGAGKNADSEIIKH